MQRIYRFGGGSTDPETSINLLGGKGANLAAMARLGIPVPPGFIIPTSACADYYEDGGRSLSDALIAAIQAEGLGHIENGTSAKFGDPVNPLLVSVRSGARRSMPGMMDTILNVGLTEATIPGLVAKTGNERFVLDSYRRLITMYADVVMEKAAGIEPEDNCGIRKQLDHILEQMKSFNGYQLDTELSVEDLKQLIGIYKIKVLEVLGQPFPDDPEAQLLGAIGAVFASWMGKRAIAYRRIESIPDEWGTAVNVQAMVFGNMGENSSTGVAFTRNPATGEDDFYGEYLVNAQGEDVVAGIRTPLSISDLAKNQPAAYAELIAIREKLEQHYRDMLDIEFTIQEGKLWMLQCRVGKRTGQAAVRIAVEMLEQGLISKEEVLMRVTPAQLDELLHSMLDPAAEAKAQVLAKGLPAGPGGAAGCIALSADRAEALANEGIKVILVREETSPEDVAGMHVAEGILTARGGMTSHAALVARGWGKCCIVGCGDVKIDHANNTVLIGGLQFDEGDFISLNGTKGAVYKGHFPMVEPNLDENKYYGVLMGYADDVRRLRVRANADTPEDAAKARKNGAEGIGLTRTEHMFFGEGRIRAMREMILAKNVDERQKALDKLLPLQRADFEGIFEAMAGLPVTIRLLDPPLHEFVPHEEPEIAALASDLDVTMTEAKQRIDSLKELNPMLGHRGCRLGITYPEITEMQARAIFLAAVNLIKRGVEVKPEIMVPLVTTPEELAHQIAIIRNVAKEVLFGGEEIVKLDYTVGTMIETPRAALVARRIVLEGGAEFFSFGTNDLTQTTFGFSRDDVGGFLPDYLEAKILKVDPFVTIDEEGVGQLVRLALEATSKIELLKTGVCGEHGGDPASVDFFHRAGLNYVSCSPFRVPIARLAAAQAAIRHK